MPGYQLLDSDRSAIAAKYLCPLCSFLLRDPVQTSCGHCYCRCCIKNVFANGTFQIQCHTCGETVVKDQIFPDNFMKRELLALQVHCPYKNEGCSWQGEVRELEAHTSECDYVQVPCPHAACGMMVRKSELVRHLESQCSCRMVKCDYCEAEISINVMEEHKNNDCRVFPVKCTKCNRNIQRSKLTDHQDPKSGDCEAISGPCPFVSVGCTQVEWMGAEDRRAHMQETVVPHVNQVLVVTTKLNEDVQSLVTSGTGPASVAQSEAAAMGATPSAAATFRSDSESTVRSLLSCVESVTEENRDLRHRLREQSDRITKVERKTASLPSNSCEGASGCRSFNPNPATTSEAEVVRRLVNVEHKVADHEVLLGENGRNVEDARHQNSYQQRQLELAQETIRRLERRVESQDHMIALRNVALADLEEYIRQQEVSSYNGVLLWKITDFTRRRNDAQGGRQTSFYSPSFYTSRHGYKMCSRIYLNGDGMGKGTHISLFFVVMRGQYDALLRWPFRQKVTLMIVDQDNIEHVIDAFRPDPNSSSFQKPQREMNIASGCPVFFPLTDLEKHAYVRDDTMFVKIIVDTSDL